MQEKSENKRSLRYGGPPPLDKSSTEWLNQNDSLFDIPSYMATLWGLGQMIQTTPHLDVSREVLCVVMQTIRVILGLILECFRLEKEKRPTIHQWNTSASEACAVKRFPLWMANQHIEGNEKSKEGGQVREIREVDDVFARAKDGVIISGEMWWIVCVRRVYSGGGRVSRTDKKVVAEVPWGRDVDEAGLAPPSHVLDPTFVTWHIGVNPGEAREGAAFTKARNAHLNRDFCTLIMEDLGAAWVALRKDSTSCWRQSSARGSRAPLLACDKVVLTWQESFPPSLKPAQIMFIVRLG